MTDYSQTGQGAKKLTAFRQFCALSQEYPAILGISPLRIKRLETVCVRRRFSSPLPGLASKPKDNAGKTERNLCMGMIDFYMATKYNKSVKDITELLIVM